VFHISEGTTNDFPLFRFYGPEAKVVLAARQYYIISRKSPATTSDEAPAAQEVDESMGENADCSDPPNRLMQAIGTRVESNRGLDGSWSVLTLVGTEAATSSGSTESTRYVLVSDDGDLHSGVSADQIRAYGSIPQDESSRSRRSGRLPGDDRHGLFPFFTARQIPDYPRGEAENSATGSNQAKALKRTWSALSLIDDMRPVDLKVSRDTKEAAGPEVSADLSLVCRLDDSEFQFLADASSVELPPCLCVLFSAHEKLPGVDLSIPADKTLVCALKEVHQKQNKWNEWPPKPTCRLFFTVRATPSDPAMALLNESMAIKAAASDDATGDSSVAVNRSWAPRQENRARKLSSRALSSDDDEDEDTVTSLCDGIDEICVQCMEVISLLSECAEDRSSANDRDVLNLPGFANTGLSKKLSEQLDDVLCGVGGALPDWCLVAPSFAPRVFSYESRRMLLERAAFGPSRSALKQQEAKVNVGRFRQRMTSLRARAVELVGEAFSGGAEDPTALQLQADELYGMEEALATRVRAAFRAVKWQEHSLQVAKAAVRRDRLLTDAAAVMDSYTNDRSVCRRRLEVRFEGESGFDAASGDEAGVTRGFYADVAEALLSAENVAGVCCSPSCAHGSPTASIKKVQPMDVQEFEEEALKLPLWIPDMDSSAQVILPTPRADKRSGLGVFPRPLPHYHPQFDEVLQRFRFMGRLFAAAMRDGFMFPLPLSSAFLKLVQNGSDAAARKEATRNPTLLSSDLPRPGFLGGEVYAADYFICRALDRLDSSDPPLSRHELKRRYEEIATDKKFARVAFGKLYECSFEEYFQDRTFVDPLDPSQDAEAVPLCPKGHAKPVTIYNIREWVALAKSFMLYEGVIEQVLAFRRGVEDFFSADYLRVFTSEELQRDVCGVGDDVDNWTENSIRKLFKLDGTSPALACVFDGILCVTATLFDSTLTIRLRYRRERRR
jgi:HECT-domain (ubiquitin-transferase)